MQPEIYPILIMLRIKKLDIFIIKSYALLFVGTFFICQFIFMMQFLWKFVDDLVGKGLEAHVLAQFFYYMGLTLVPQALPLAILLASLMTFGNFGERYELLAMKAAGISLIKIMRPLAVFAFILSCVSFYFQNVITPHAQLKLYTLIYSIRQKSPEVQIPEGVFYDEISGLNIYVKHRNRETGMLYDVMIYDLSKGFENANTIYADSGRLETTADEQHLNLYLYNGESFENLTSQKTKNESEPYRRENFREKRSLFEFNSGFDMMDESYVSSMSASKDIAKLNHSIDSMVVVGDSIGRKYYTDARSTSYQAVSHLNKDDSLKISTAQIEDYNVDSLFNRSTLAQKQRILTTAESRTSNLTSDWSYKSMSINSNDYQIRRHRTEWHLKFVFSLACLIFFFIGGSLGSIIRKGGLGMPVVVSVLIFIFYYIIYNMGYKMARDGKWIMVAGMWLSTAVLLPIGAFLTYKANNDSVVLNADAYVAWFKRVLGIRSVRNMVRKEVIINDPDYAHLPEKLQALTARCRDYMTAHRLNKAPNYFKLWITEKQDQEIHLINDELEAVVEEMGNSRSNWILAALNDYPIIPASAHTKPFNIEWLNIITGLVFPVGLFFHFRIWVFRIRLQKDLEKIIKTNQTIERLIEENKI